MFIAYFIEEINFRWFAVKSFTTSRNNWKYRFLQDHTKIEKHNIKKGFREIKDVAIP